MNFAKEQDIPRFFTNHKIYVRSLCGMQQRKIYFHRQKMSEGEKYIICIHSIAKFQIFAKFKMYGLHIQHRK